MNAPRPATALPWGLEFVGADTAGPNPADLFDVGPVNAGGERQDHRRP